MSDPEAFVRESWLICKTVPEKRSVGGVLGWYNGKRVVSIRCDSQACRHVYDSDGRSHDAIVYHLWDVDTGECVHTEHVLKPSSQQRSSLKGKTHG